MMLSGVMPWQGPRTRLKYRVNCGVVGKPTLPDSKTAFSKGYRVVVAPGIKPQGGGTPISNMIVNVR